MTPPGASPRPHPPGGVATAPSARARLRRMTRRLWILWRRIVTGRFDLGAVIKPVMPRGLFGRSLIIIVAPVVLLQAIVTYIFFERHWDVVTRRLTESVAGDIAMVVETHAALEDPARFDALADQVDRTMAISVRFWPDDTFPRYSPAGFYSILDRSLRRELARRLEYPVWFNTARYPHHVDIRVAVDGGILRFIVLRNRVMATNGPIFVMWMLGSSVVLLGVAIVFLRNQVRPIIRLAEAAESFGKGRETESFKPSGAREVRQAAIAFLDMRERINRHLTQRTEMLAGVSHDLRTPLTRLKLELALLGDGPEIEDMRRDLTEMERMLEEYLAFAKGEGGESAEETDLRALLEETADKARRNGLDLTLSVRGTLTMPVRRQALARAITNLLDNAAKHGTRAEVTGRRDPVSIRIMVDDDGPGIPESRWEEAFRPFHRLDEGRNLEAGGVGLGLAVSRDIVRAHGGEVSLDHSPLGGLRATIRLPL
ncbi:MAG: sensor histidine kinase [Alphaproteobacteria bacterium]